SPRSTPGCTPPPAPSNGPPPQLRPQLRLGHSRNSHPSIAPPPPCMETPMKRFAPLIAATAACATALFLLAQPAAAQTNTATAPPAAKAEQKGGERTHRLILQVDTNDP